MDFIGRLHPLLLHLPIGILLYAYLHWTYEQYISKKQKSTSFRFALSLGAITAIFSAISGLVLAKDGGYDEQLLNWHKYLGITTALGAVVLIWIYTLEINKHRFFALFTAFILLLSVTGHYGGSLTHGVDFLSSVSSKTSQINIENIQEADIFSDIVMPLVEKKCVSCHNPQKAKGGLVLHDQFGWEAGGKNGSILKFGLADQSSLIQRIFLPKEDDKHMPPSGKLQLTEEERNFLRWWVDNMQDYKHKVNDLATTPKVESYLKSLQAGNAPKVDKPSASQLAKLRTYGLDVSFQASNVPWVDVSLLDANNFDVGQLRRLKRIAPAIKTIDLSHSDISDVDIDVIRKFKNLEKIDVSNSQITNKAIARLTVLPVLKSLNLIGTRVTEDVFTSAVSFKKLEKIYVWETAISDEEIENWQDQKPDLEIVHGIDYSIFKEAQLVSPTITAEQDLFTDSLLINIETKAKRADIKFTLDGSNPTEKSKLYCDPFYIHQTTEVKAILVMNDWENSEATSRTFAKSRFPIRNLKTSIAPNEKYAADGMRTLIDLKKGSDSFGDGKWLGFYGEDVILTADLGEAQKISGITIGTLSDFGFYIHLPKSIQVEVSKDGQNYSPFQKKKMPTIDGPSDAQVHNQFISAATTSAQYLRIRFEHQKVNPPSHPAPGATCWLFIDEILVE